MGRPATGHHVHMETRPTWQTAGIVAGAFVALLWVLEIVDTASGHRLDDYGVRPRTDEGLLGVVLAPTLHFGFEHLISNTVPVVGPRLPGPRVRHRPRTPRDRRHLGGRRSGRVAGR